MGGSTTDALTPMARDVLAALSAGGVPRPRTWLYEFLAQPGVRETAGRRPTQDDIRQAIHHLAERELIEQSERRPGFWRVVASHASDALHGLLARASLPAIRDALAVADQYRSLTFTGRIAGDRVPTMEAALALVRVELFGGASPSAIDKLNERLPWGVDARSLIAPAFEAGLNDALYSRLDPAWQLHALGLAWHAWVTGWQRSEELSLQQHTRQWMAELGRDATMAMNLAPLAWAYSEYLCCTGDHQELAVLEDRSCAFAGLNTFRLACTASGAALRGHWAEAEPAFEQALAGLRAETGRRHHLLPSRMAWLYVTALLGRRQPSADTKALKFCLGEGGKKEPVLDSPFGFAALALQMRHGDAATSLAPFMPPRHSVQGYVSPLDLARWQMRAWLKTGPLPEPIGAEEAHAAESLQSALREAGLTRLEGEFAAAMGVLAGSDAPAWYFVPGPEAPWKAALNALGAVAYDTGAPTTAKKADEPTRLVWLLETTDDGRVLGLVPHDQKQGVRGWGRPKEAPLSRLQRQAAALAPHDAPLAAAIRQESYGRGCRLDVAAALSALPGHPYLAFADAPDRWVELTEAGPELDVVEQADDQLLVRMLPEMNVGHDAAAPRWAGSAAEQKEFDALRSIRVLRDSPQRARLVQLTPAQKRVAQLLGPQGLRIPREGVAQLQQVLAGLGTHFRIHADAGVAAEAVREVPAVSRLRAELTPAGQGLQLRLVAAPFGDEYRGDGPRLIPGQGRVRIVASLRGERLGVQRDLDAERAHRDAVLDACAWLPEPDESAPCDWQLDEPEHALATVEALHRLAGAVQMDWPQGRALRVESAGLGQLTLRVHTRQHWLAVDGELRFDETLVLGLQQLIGAAAGGSRFVPLGEGRYVALTQELRERLSDLAAVAEAQRAKGDDLAALRLPNVAAPWLEQVAEGALVEFDAGFVASVRRLDEARRLVPRLPATLQATLRPYQEEGFEWAMRLSHAGLGACLADDMGLGKTLQALAVLLSRARQGPALVVAPTSLIGNWRAEAQRFAPTLSVRVYGEAGTQQTRQAAIAEATAGQLWLVSYPLLQIDAEAFAEREWATVVLDEAQAIKNAAAKRSQAVFSLRAGFRLALSGTPIENRLAELWSIMRAVNPGLLGTAARFAERFAGPIERQRDKHAQKQLRRLIAPFVLRRTKAQVLDDLPPRTELILRVQPDETELTHYEALRRDALIAAERALEGDAPGQAHLNVLAGLTRLRRAACDPRLVSPQLGIRGAKVQAFAELAAELVANGHKTLVFSQFVDFLALLREPLDAAGIAYQYLDGSTPAAERTKRVDAFQAGQGEFFLISLKAGGFGLNLTAADYVVIADPWWNPAAEDQASGRAHRIGQQRPVTVYRLVNQATLEEKILTLHHDKRELADLLLEGTDAAARMPPADELLALMRADDEAAGLYE